MEMATNVVIGVSCAHIGLGLLYLLGVGDGGEKEESKSRDMKSPFMEGLDGAKPCSNKQKNTARCSMRTCFF